MALRRNKFIISRTELEKRIDRDLRETSMRIHSTPAPPRRLFSYRRVLEQLLLAAAEHPDPNAVITAWARERKLHRIWWPRFGRNPADAIVDE